MQFNFDIIGVWFLVLMTLSILSYLYGDNPFYKAAEHIFVGVSAGYIFALTWWDRSGIPLPFTLTTWPDFIPFGTVRLTSPFIVGTFTLSPNTA